MNRWNMAFYSDMIIIDIHEPRGGFGIDGGDKTPLFHQTYND